MPSSTASARPRRNSTHSRSTDSRSARGDRRRPAAGTPRPAQRTAVRAASVWDDMPVQIVPTENLPGFGELGLPASLVGALVRAGITAPFPIQAATIPDIIAGRDLLGRASTGSGKTLAFGLPLITRVEGSPSRSKKPRGLVLVPTRELAMQVTDALTPLANSRNVTVRLVAGGLPIGKQITALERGVDILVATPGRLIDLIERRTCDLSDVEVTVLDEADHMADLGFLPVVRRLLDMTARGGQRLLFSATLDGDVAVVVSEYLTDPAVHALHTAVASVDTMSHHLFRVEHESKFTVVERDRRPRGPHDLVRAHQARCRADGQAVARGRRRGRRDPRRPFAVPAQPRIGRVQGRPGVGARRDRRRGPWHPRG